MSSFKNKLRFFIHKKGLASLTGIIVFIAAVNGAVDQKLTVVLTGDDEPIFKYSYGMSFFFAVISFLLQEFNGICNIYWYIDYYRKYRFNKEASILQNGTSISMPIIPYLNKIEINKQKKPLVKKELKFNELNIDENDKKKNKSNIVKNNFLHVPSSSPTKINKQIEKIDGSANEVNDFNLTNLNLETKKLTNLRKNCHNSNSQEINTNNNVDYLKLNKSLNNSSSDINKMNQIYTFKNESGMQNNALIKQKLLELTSINNSAQQTQPSVQLLNSFYPNPNKPWVNNFNVYIRSLLAIIF